MPTLMIGDCFLLFLRDKPFSLDSTDHPLRRNFKIDHLNFFFVQPGGENGCLVAQISNLSSAEARAQGSQSSGILLFSVLS